MPEVSGRKRAIYDDQKQARRAQILAAARQLVLRGNGRLATVSEVARRAGIAKGTVYLYFRTKEEIYIAYYEELMLALLARLRSLCETETGNLAERIVDAVCEFAQAHPEFLRLASLINGVLEQNASADFIEGYKSRLGAALIETAARLAQALRLPIDEVTRLLLQTHAVSVGLWQQAALPKAVRELLKKRPDLAFYQIDFAAELRAVLTVLWHRRE